MNGSFRCFQLPMIVPKDANIQPVVEAAYNIVEDATPVQSRRQRKRKSVVVDAGRASHPPKKLREDHGTLSRASISECKDGDHTDSMAEPNLRTIEALRRFVIFSDSSHHSCTNVAEAEDDYLIRSFAPIMTTVTITTATVDPTSITKEKVVEPSLFVASSSSAGGTNPSFFSDLTGSDFLVGAIRTVINPDTDLQKVYVPQWSMTNGSRLNDRRVCSEMVNKFSPIKFFASIRGMEHDQLFTKFNVRAAHQMSLSAEVRMRAEYNVKEKRRLMSMVESQGKLLKAREEEIRSLKARLLLKKAKAAKAIRLRAEASNFETIEKSLRDDTNSLRERNVILEKERDALDVKVTELETSAMSKECQLTDLNALVTSIKSQNDSLVDQVHELDISSSGLHYKVTMYENCMEHLKKFQDDRMKIVEDKTTISKAIEKGMQDRLAARLPMARKDASVEAIMEIIRLEEPVAEKLVLNELQPNVDWLMVPNHSSPNKVVIGAIALSFALDASSSRVRQIRENIVNHRLVLCDVFVSLSEPFSTSALTGVEGTSGIVPTTATTMALFTTLASTSIVNPISIDDYEFVDVDN
nr:hypothetical protein [Tanacetum cinerariifolium]